MHGASLASAPHKGDPDVVPAATVFARARCVSRLAATRTDLEAAEQHADDLAALYLTDSSQVVREAAHRLRIHLQHDVAAIGPAFQRRAARFDGQHQEPAVAVIACRSAVA